MQALLLSKQLDDLVIRERICFVLSRNQCGYLCLHRLPGDLADSAFRYWKSAPRTLADDDGRMRLIAQRSKHDYSRHLGTDLWV